MSKKKKSVVDLGVQAFLNGTPVAAPPRVPQHNDHFFFPEILPKLPWEMFLDERRRVSRNPRIMKQVLEEDQWLGTSCSGLWKLMAPHAKSINDWKMNYEQVDTFFSELGVKGTHFVPRVIEVFDPTAQGFLNALILCKLFLMVLTPAHEMCEFFVAHCFSRFDRQPDTDVIIKKSLFTAVLRPPLDRNSAEFKNSISKKKKSKKGDNDPRPVSLNSGATWGNVDGLKTLLPTITLKNELVIDYAEFRTLFLNPNNGEWVGTFALSLFECGSKYFTAPYGRLPCIPLRWLNTIEPIPFGDVIHDADIVLLKEIEISGIDPKVGAMDKKKKKGKKA